ncbi:MAG: ABC transporter [Rickettsiales bacterium]|nr:ABC transporter [Rickettsiales bacterium]RPG12607.1 MAG: ABC transporter ATP-binding protein [Pelagibacteraceae bacterium TMED195]
MNYHINVVNLVKNFDEQSVIKNISFKVKKNSIVGILGKNGAGKTTLLGMLLGLITPTKGDVYILGKNLKLNKKEILSEINFQSPYVDLPKKMTVEQNLCFYSRLYGIKNFNKVIENLANELKVKDLLKKNYGSLSAGQKTKINLCKALLNKPKLLLLDEPTASLDPETSIFIRNYLLEYQKRTSSSILITSHNLNEVQAMCSNIILLKSGEIVSEGNIKQVLKKYNYKTLIELFLSKG